MASNDTIYKEKIDLFYGGISDDIRIQKPEVFFITQHFDAYTHPKRLVPFRAMEENQTTAYSIVLFLYANSKLYGLGIVESTARAKVYEKSGDVITSGWTASSSGEDGGGSRSTVCFIEYHNFIFGGAAGTRIWGYGDITGAASFTSTAYSGAGAPVCQGIVTADDKLIIPCDSGIALKDGAGAGVTSNWSVYSIVPSGYTPTDICELNQDLVAISARPTTGYGGSRNSKVFLWDKVSQDPNAVIDFGEGDLYLVDELEGELVGISSVGGLSAFAIRPKLTVRKWSGGTKAVVEKEIEGDSGSTITIYGNHTKVKDINRIVFGLKITMDGTTFNQLFSVGRKAVRYPLSFTGDRLVDNDTAITAINGVGKLGNYYFVAHNSDGSVNRTDDQAVYTNATPIYISQKLTGESKVQDAHRRDKVLVMAGVLCKPLSSGQSVSLYYRVNENSSWTLIRTLSTTNAIGFEAGSVGSSNDPFLVYKEAQLKATSAGGAEITGIVWAWKFAGADIVSE